MSLTYSWNSVTVAMCDPNSPGDTILMEAMRQNDIMLYEWIGKSYTPAEDHDHDGVNSALFSFTGKFLCSGSAAATSGATGAGVERPQLYFRVSIPVGKILKLKRARYYIDEFTSDDLRLRIGNATYAVFESSASRGDQTPDFTLYDNSAGGSAFDLDVYCTIKNTGSVSRTIYAYSGWICEFEMA